MAQKTKDCPFYTLDTNIEIIIANNLLTRYFRKATKGLTFGDEEFAKSATHSCSSDYAIFATPVDRARWTVQAIPMTEEVMPNNAAFLGWLIHDSAKLDMIAWEKAAADWLQGFFQGHEGIAAVTASTYRQTVHHEWYGDWYKTLASVMMDMIEDQIQANGRWIVEFHFTKDILGAQKRAEAWQIAETQRWTWDDWDNLTNDANASTKLLTYLHGLFIRRPDEEDIQTLAFLEERIEVLKQSTDMLQTFIEVVGSHTDRFLP